MVISRSELVSLMEMVLLFCIVFTPLPFFGLEKITRFKKHILRKIIEQGPP